MRSSVKVSQMPFVRKAISRKRWESVWKLNSVSSKISWSGLNQVVVPVTLAEPLPSVVFSEPLALPRS